MNSIFTERGFFRFIKKTTITFFFISLCVGINTITAQINDKVFPGADERTPSLSQYFSWVNNNNEGSTEGQTLDNLEFFNWLHDEYGMTLDIYAFDAGAIDKGHWYGSMESEEFKAQFPNGFEPIYKKAKEMDNCEHSNCKT